jgi:hypothetical protein
MHIYANFILSIDSSPDNAGHEFLCWSLTSIDAGRERILVCPQISLLYQL